MIKAIYIFYVMKFAPWFIDNKSHSFWQFNVRLLNSMRQSNSWVLWSCGRLIIRDPYSLPMKTCFAYSRRFHPFVWQRKPHFENR